MCGFQRQGPVLGAVHHPERCVGVANPFRRVEHPQTEPRREHASQGCVHVLLLDQPLTHSLGQSQVGPFAAFQVGSRQQRPGRRLHFAAHELVPAPDVVDGPAVRHDVAAEAPLFAQDLLQQPATGATGLVQRAVVGAHHGLSLSPLHAQLERREVGFAQIVLVDNGVEAVSLRFRTAVHDVVLGGGHGFQVVGILALETFDKGHGQRAGQVGILAVGLHPATPARVAKQVYVGRPEGEPLEDFATPVSDELVVLGPSLVRNRCRHAEQQLGVPGGGQTDWLRENGGDTGPRYAVKRLVPPVVSRNAQAFHRWCAVKELGHFFFQRQAGHQVVHALFEGEIRIPEGEFVRGRFGHRFLLFVRGFVFLCSVFDPRSRSVLARRRNNWPAVFQRPHTDRSVVPLFKRSHPEVLRDG